MFERVQKWADKYDWAAHGILAFLLCFINPWFAAGFMLAIEGTQIDLLGLKPGRRLDTLTDLLFDILGIAAFIIVM